MRIDWNRRYTSIAVYTLIVFLFCFFIYKTLDNWAGTKKLFSHILSILSPFLMGMLIAYLINPLIVKIEKLLVKKGFPGSYIKSPKKTRAISIFLTYLFLFALLCFLLEIMIPQLVASTLDFINQLPDNLNKLICYLNDLYLHFDGIDYYLDMVYLSDLINANLPNTFEKLSAMLSNLIPNLVLFTRNFIYGVINTFLSLIISIYLLSGKEVYVLGAKKIVIALFPPKKANALLETFAFSHQVFSSFFISRLIESVLVGLLCFLVLLMVDMPFALLISVIVGITDMIPYFGPFIGGGFGFMLLVIVDPVKAFWFLLIIVGIQQFDGNILGPKILSNSIGLSPFWTIFSIVLFGSMFGFIGLLLGAPLFCVIKTLFDQYIEREYSKKTSQRASNQNE